MGLKLFWTPDFSDSLYTEIGGIIYVLGEIEEIAFFEEENVHWRETSWDRITFPRGLQKPGKLISGNDSTRQYELHFIGEMK